MAINEKKQFLSDVEKRLSDEITATQLQLVLASIADVLQFYSLSVVEIEATTNDDMLDAYTSALLVEGKSHKTVDRYRYILKRMMAFVKTPTRSITVYHIRNYIASEKNRGIADRTLEGYREVFNAYFGWLCREGLIPNNPVANLGAIKYAKKEKDVFSETDIEKMKFGCSSIRDRAIICFLKATGCRISEMTQLNRNDVDLNKLECIVLGKGNKERTVYLDSVAGMVLDCYLKSRSDNAPALFVGKGSERLTPGGVRFILKKLGATTNVTHVHPHKFRRTAATNLIKHGMPIQEVAAILGHDKLDTTMQYIVLDKAAIKSSYNKYI